MVQLEGSAIHEGRCVSAFNQVNSPIHFTRGFGINAFGQLRHRPEDLFRSTDRKIDLMRKGTTQTWLEDR